MTGAAEPTGAMSIADTGVRVCSFGVSVGDWYWKLCGSDGSLRCLELRELNLDVKEEILEVSVCLRAVNSAIVAS